MWGLGGNPNQGIANMTADNGAKMDLVENEPQFPTLIVKTLTDRKLVVEIGEGVSNIGHIRTLIKNKESEDVADNRLVFKGRVLEDSENLEEIFKDETEKVLHLFYYEPSALLADPLDLASDWDAKNRLKVFKGVYHLSKRQFSEGADLLCDSLATFAEPSFFSFRDCVRYAVLSGCLVFDRPQLQKRILRSPEVLEVISDISQCERLVSSLYNCHYAEFFKSLAEIEQWLRQDWLLCSHTDYLVKELRIKAYKQLLTAYRSLKLSAMAQAFAVSVDFIDRELSRFIAGGRLNCTINRVEGMVESVPVDLKRAQNTQLLKEGDALFNKVQRLGRMVSY